MRGATKFGAVRKIQGKKWLGAAKIPLKIGEWPHSIHSNVA
jgi:hypothetical protein